MFNKLCKKYFLTALILLMFLFNGLDVFSQSDSDLNTTEKVEVTVSLEGITKDNARTKCLKSAKKQAVENNAKSLMPPDIAKERLEDYKEVFEDYERFVLSWEKTSEDIEDNNMTMNVLVTLDKQKIKSALKSKGVLPSRAMPKVFILVPGIMEETPVFSAWEKEAGLAGRFNQCETQIETELLKYGFKVIYAKEDSPSLDTKMVLNPEDDEERSRIFLELKEKFGAEVLVVGRSRSKIKEPGPGETGDQVEVTVQIALADINKTTVLWSDKLLKTYPAKGLLLYRIRSKWFAERPGRKQPGLYFGPGPPDLSRRRKGRYSCDFKCHVLAGDEGHREEI